MFLLLKAFVGHWSRTMSRSKGIAPDDMDKERRRELLRSITFYWKDPWFSWLQQTADLLQTNKPIEPDVDQHSPHLLLWDGGEGSGQSRVRSKLHLYILNGPVSFKVTIGFLPELNSKSLSVHVIEMK